MHCRISWSVHDDVELKLKADTVEEAVHWMSVLTAVMAMEKCKVLYVYVVSYVRLVPPLFLIIVLSKCVFPLI